MPLDNNETESGIAMFASIVCKEEMVNCNLCGERIKKDDAVDDGCSNYHCKDCAVEIGLIN